jgi:hypothetical protein
MVHVAQVVCLWLMSNYAITLLWEYIYTYTYIHTMALTYIKPDKSTYLVLKDLAKMNGIDAHCNTQYTSIPFTCIRVLRVQPNFRYGKKVLVKRCTNKTKLRLPINTKLVPSLFNGQPKVNARERLELVGSLFPYIGLRWPYIVCL